MARPRLTFFCDLEPEALQKLFADTEVIDDLLQLQVGVRLALLDLSPERAAVAPADESSIMDLFCEFSWRTHMVTRLAVDDWRKWPLTLKGDQRKHRLGRKEA